MKEIVIKIYNEEELQNALHEIVSALDYENVEYDYEVKEGE